jgi:DNA-binding NarL/FixJ family response regulator
MRTLTPQDRRVAELLMNGYPDAVIASALEKSLHTVKPRIGKLYDLFDVPTNLCRRIVFALYLHAHRKQLGLYCFCCDGLEAGKKQ